MYYYNYLLSVCDVINFENHMSFFMKPFFYLAKDLGWKIKYLKKENSF